MKKNIIIAVSILATLITLNYFFVSAPNQREQTIQYKKELKINDIKASYKLCELNAETEYYQDWAGQCDVKGEDSSCFLSLTSSDLVNKRWQDKKDRCFDNYKLELGLIK